MQASAANKQQYELTSMQQKFTERTMTNVNQAPLPRLSKAPMVRASLVKWRYIKYLAFFKAAADSMQYIYNNIYNK